MLATSYGIDCALSQIVYYHHTNQIDFATISNKMINRFLQKVKPKILVGLRPDIEYVDEATIIVDNTKRGYELYSEYDNFFYESKVSKTHIFSTYLKTNNDLVKYALLADSLCTGQYTDNNILFLDFYNAVGQDAFVYKFISDGELLLNKNEQQLALRFRKYQDETADQYVSNFLTIQNNVAICRSNYSMKDAIENSILSKYRDEIFLIITWDYESDGTFRVSLCSKTDIAGKIAEELNGDNYIRSGMVKLKIDNTEEINDPSDYISEQILEMYNQIIEKDQKTKFFDKQQEIEGNQKYQENSESLFDNF